MTFLLGVVVGAGGLFAWLRTVPHEPASVTAGTGSLPAPRNPDLEAQLPPPPQVTAQNGPDLAELDLPLRPGTGDAPAASAASSGTAAPASAPASAPSAAPEGKLLVPVDGINPAQLTDTFNQARGNERRHEALDIMAPKGTKVVAVADGRVAKLFTSKPGGLTVYQFDPSEKYAYYYAHLDRYADGLKEGAEIKRGDLIGYVGVTGNSDPGAPHLHFALFELTPEKQWWKGTPVNPYPLMKP
jgi:murein DD-endopeptidase MepM/ murein hydrolase activator NlpD